MMNFTTEALLYPLITKGEAAGHPFRGNQWTTGQGGGSEKEATPRPPLGKYQLTPDETNTILQHLRNFDLPYDQRIDQATVAMAKMLGYDKPATEVTSFVENQGRLIYRGCDMAGAKSLLEPLQAYGKNGGITYGSGIYFADDERSISTYNKGAVVTAQVALGTPTLISGSSEYRRVEKAFYKTIEGLSDEKTPSADNNSDKQLMSMFACLNGPIAMMMGYKAYASPQAGMTMVFDRSALRVVISNK